jgi:hypothetical protein
MRTFRMSPVGLGAVIGAAVAFVLVGAAIVVLWVVLGAVVGGALGMVVTQFGRKAVATRKAIDLTENASQAQLLEEARKLDIPGRTTMDKNTLAREIAERQAS